MLVHQLLLSDPRLILPMSPQDKVAFSAGDPRTAMTAATGRKVPGQRTQQRPQTGFRGVINRGARNWAMTGAALGGALGAVNPGEDENGNTKSRTWGAIKGMGAGALMGGLGNLAARRIDTQMVQPYQKELGRVQRLQANAAAKAKATGKGKAAPKANAQPGATPPAAPPTPAPKASKGKKPYEKMNKPPVDLDGGGMTATASLSLIKLAAQVDPSLLARMGSGLAAGGRAILPVIANAGPIGWGSTGAAIGAASGAWNPGVDPETGEPRSRIGQAISRASLGGLLGTTGGFAVNRLFSTARPLIPGKVAGVGNYFTAAGNTGRRLMSGAGQMGWGATGAALGGALGAWNPGTNEDGSTKSRLWGAIKGMGTGALLGATGGWAAKRLNASGLSKVGMVIDPVRFPALAKVAMSISPVGSQKRVAMDKNKPMTTAKGTSVTRGQVGSINVTKSDAAPKGPTASPKIVPGVSSTPASGTALKGLRKAAA